MIKRVNVPSTRIERSGMSLVTRTEPGATRFFHARLEDVPLTVLKLGPNPTFVFSEHRPVIIVELLDDLECPSTVQHVATDQVGS